ncbi:MAG TPA: hypothetical protein VFC36_00795 [Paludibacter sp.]|nr:hypothetical protein [Paludibacter sp.]
MFNVTQFVKASNHDHYWIEDGELYESYRTLRGLRYRFLGNVAGMPDIDNCTEAMMIYIEKEYLQTTGLSHVD